MAIIPSEENERRYARQFSSRLGAPANWSRFALGALIIKQRMKISDEKTVERIKENPYLQLLLSFEGFTTEVPFDASMMVYFRKRFEAKTLEQINELIIEHQREQHRGRPIPSILGTATFTATKAAQQTLGADR